MKIQALNNTNFKGIFIDKTKENNGNWRMEYHPYSWEWNPNGKRGMAAQLEWDILADTLPDNEKKFEQKYKYSQYGGCETNREFCKDILGTEFYYNDKKNDSIRKTITEMPPMTLEESLIVRNKKLYDFLYKKSIKAQELEKEFNTKNEEIKTEDYWYWHESKDYDKGFLERNNRKDVSKTNMDKYHKQSVLKAQELYNATQDYLKLKRSEIDVKREFNENKRMIEQLEKARKEGNLVDISRQTINEPLKPFYDALDNLETAVKKIIAFPKSIKTMSYFIEPHVKNGLNKEQIIKACQHELNYILKF